MTQPLRIALVMRGGRGWIGGMEYIRNIVLALACLPKAVRDTFEISLLANKSTDKYFIESVRPYLKSIYEIDNPGRPAILNRIKCSFISAVLKRPDCRNDAFLEKEKFDFIYPGIFTGNGRNYKKTAAWIYDFQHKYLPELFSENEINERDRQFSQIANHASLVVLSSKSAEADFKRFYPAVHSKTKILSFRTIPQTQWHESNPLDTQRIYNLPDKFFIISNQFWQHKNHLIVFKALNVMKERGINPIVVCTGHIYDYRKPDYSDLILQTIHRSGLAQQVFILGLIPKIDQIQLLRRSIALIQPSLFEGWSTVVEDARCLGKPAVLSDFPVHLEQNPPNSLFFDRTSPESLARVMENCWEILVPGPDFAMESTAMNTNKKEVVEFANNFMAIAKSLKYADEIRQENIG